MTYPNAIQKQDDDDDDDNVDEASSLLTIATAAPSFSFGQDGGEVPTTKKKKNGVPLRLMIATVCFLLGTLAVLYSGGRGSSRHNNTHLPGGTSETLLLRHSQAALDTASKGIYMDCGDAPLCGVLTLETGLGSGPYHHDFVSVHGLWPEVGDYGTSACIPPAASFADPRTVYSCYDHHHPGGGDSSGGGSSGNSMGPLTFETHEWEKHGTCAGVQDATDFFTQLCALSTAPLAVMDAVKTAGHVDLNDYKARLTSAGYEVFATGTWNMQLMLSACAGEDGQWKLAAVAQFSDTCPGGGTGPTQTVPPPGALGGPCNYFKKDCSQFDPSYDVCFTDTDNPGKYCWYDMASDRFPYGNWKGVKDPYQHIVNCGSECTNVN